MRVLEDLKIGKSVKYRIKGLESLPERAKEIMFAAMDDLSMENDGSLSVYWAVAMGNYLECESPIEKILHVAIDFVCVLRLKEFGNWNFVVYPQEEIYYKEKTYRADFVMMAEKYKGNVQDDDVIYFVVECDGHEYHHTTKDQVNRDNERDMQIKLAGYDVLRFSGSQIFRDPFKCANDIIDYALTKISRK